MQKQSKSGVAVAYANNRWAIMFPDNLSDVDQWLPEAQVLMMDLRRHVTGDKPMGYKIIKPPPKPKRPKK